MSESVNTIVWKGKRDISAKQFYDRMNALMLRTSVRSSLNMEGNQRPNQKLLEWMVDLDNIFVEFDLCGTPKTDAAIKAHTMSRIGLQWRSVALLLGNDEGVSYLLASSNA